VTERHNDHTLFSIYSENKFPVLPLTLKPRSKRNPREYGLLESTSVCSVPFCHPENLPAEVVYQKQHHLMPHDVPVSPPTRNSPTPRPRETESTLFQPQLHSTIGYYTFVYILKSSDESDALFSWTTDIN
jgi:hypothetical protein